jgi:hypothetical protein
MKWLKNILEFCAGVAIAAYSSVRHPLGDCAIDLENKTITALPPKKEPEKDLGPYISATAYDLEVVYERLFAKRLHKNAAKMALARGSFRKDGEILIEADDVIRAGSALLTAMHVISDKTTEGEDAGIRNDKVQPNQG